MNLTLPSTRLIGALVALALGAACASQPQPAGTWVRRRDIFFCDWEGGHNQGSLSFVKNGDFAEQFDFEGNGKRYSTNASGHWAIKGETLTVDLDSIAGRGERSPPSQKMRLHFAVAQHSSMLQLTLTEFEHEDAGEPRQVVEIPGGERCTAIYLQRSSPPRPWRRALAALGLRARSDEESRSGG